MIFFWFAPKCKLCFRASLIHFIPLVFFYTSWKRQKNIGYSQLYVLDFRWPCVLDDKKRTPKQVKTLLKSSHFLLLLKYKALNCTISTQKHDNWMIKIDLTFLVRTIDFEYLTFFWFFMAHKAEGIANFTIWICQDRLISCNITNKNCLKLQKKSKIE